MIVICNYRIESNHFDKQVRLGGDLTISISQSFVWPKKNISIVWWRYIFVGSNLTIVLNEWTHDKLKNVDAGSFKPQ